MSLSLSPMLDQSGEVWFCFFNFVFFLVSLNQLCFSLRKVSFNRIKILDRFVSSCPLCQGSIIFNLLYILKDDLICMQGFETFVCFYLFDSIGSGFDVSEALLLIQSVLNQAIVEARFSLPRFPVSGMFPVEYRLVRPAAAYLWVNQANLATRQCVFSLMLLQVSK